MSITEAQKKYLRGLGHELNPVVMVGNAGVSPAVTAELDRALEHHELVKIKVRMGDRKARNAAIDALCVETGAQLIQRIGHTALIYRALEKDPKITLPAS